MTTYNNHPSCRLVCNNHLSSRFNTVQSPCNRSKGWHDRRQNRGSNDSVLLTLLHPNLADHLLHFAYSGLPHNAMHFSSSMWFMPACLKPLKEAVMCSGVATHSKGCVCMCGHGTEPFAFQSVIVSMEA